MLEEKDLQAIAQLILASEERLRAEFHAKLEMEIRASEERMREGMSAEFHAGENRTHAYIENGVMKPIRLLAEEMCIRDSRMPWLKGEDALNIIRDYVNLRYRLLPTYYNLSHENYETGMPLVRRLDFEYPEYESASRNDQYLLGEDILICLLYTSPCTDSLFTQQAFVL